MRKHIVYSLLALFFPMALYAASYLVEFDEFPLYDFQGDGTIVDRYLTTNAMISIEPSDAQTFELTLHRPNEFPLNYDELYYTAPCLAFPCVTESPGKRRTVNYTLTQIFDPFAGHPASFQSLFEIDFETIVPVDHVESYRTLYYRHRLTLPDETFVDLLGLAIGQSISTSAGFSAYHVDYTSLNWDDWLLFGSGPVTFTALDPPIETDPQIAPVPISKSATALSIALMLLGLLAIRRSRKLVKTPT